MTEGLFFITTLFVAYVVYVIFNEKKANPTTSKPAATVAAPAEQKATVEDKSITTEVKPKPATTKTAAKPTTAKKAAPVKAEPEPKTIKGSGLKDPSTGEVATTYTNYRFTKRWIKEALVAEKLVEKIYKNDELNADIEAKIKAGIIKLESMKKYKP